jgi:hypothetical protein
LGLEEKRLDVFGVEPDALLDDVPNPLLVSQQAVEPLA